MPLPSQMSSPIRSRSHMYRRRKPKRQPVLMVLLVVAVLSLGVWYLLPDGENTPGPQAAQAIGQVPEDDPARDSAPTENHSAPAITDPTAARESTSPPPAARDESPSIVMGQGGESRALDTPTETHAQPTPQPGTPGARTEPARTTSRSGARPAETGNISARLRQKLERGWNLLAANQLVDARQELSGALASGILTAAEADQVRQALTDLNEQLVFSPYIADGDRFAIPYVIEGGDLLSGIVRKLGHQVDWRFIQRINNISDPGRIRAGQRLKLITGPFHAVVHKRDFRLDLYLGEEDDLVFVRSFQVGLGEFNSTPVGHFRIRPKSKLINPRWVNPRTGEVFQPDDPANPIGERWLGLQGLDEQTRDLAGYGVHGTIQPQSIGQEASMGCVRMRSDDVEIIYEVLIESVSTLEIRND